MSRDLEIDRYTLQHRGLTFVVAHIADLDAGPPWEEGDGYGIITKPISYLDERIDQYRDNPQYREMPVDRGAARYYDLAATMKKAKKEDWGLSRADLAALTAKIGRTPTAKEIRAAAVDADYEFHRGWCADEWQYIGVEVHLQDFPACRGSLWALESNAGEYLKEVARDLAEQVRDRLVEEIPKKIAQLQDLAKTLSSTPNPTTAPEGSH